jgi:hypothetical protein
MEAKVRILDSLEVLGGIALDTKSHEDVARLYAALNTYARRPGYRRCVSERHVDLEDLRANLGDAAFQELYDQGHRSHSRKPSRTPGADAPHEGLDTHLGCHPARHFERCPW